MIDFGAILRALKEAEVEFVVVGGLAVGANGFVRATKDVDVLVASSEESMQQIKAALGGMGATRPNGSPLSDDLFDGEHPVQVLTPYGQLDVMPEGDEPLTFETVRNGALKVEVEGVEVDVVGLRELVLLKRLSGRPQDLEDLRRLEIAHGKLPETD